MAADEAHRAPEPLISVQDLCKDFVRGGAFSGGRGRVRAVQAVSFEVYPGETLGVVGESGCGKSTLGRMVVGLLEPTSGRVLVRGESLWEKKAHAEYAAFRKSLAGVLQMVFQDPYSSLNPRMRVGSSVAEPLICSSAWRRGREAPSGEEIRELVARMLVQVGLEPDAAERYPHEFSGGQRQRVAIARALVTRPAFVVCDEPTSSLDASVQSQVLNLLRDLQDELGLTCLFISHDLAVVRHMSDRVAVMYKGFLVEEGEAEALFAAPCHPYTRLLLASVPGAARPDGEAAAHDMAHDMALDVAHDAPGLRSSGPAGACPFLPRCAWAEERCREGLPPLLSLDETGETGETGEADGKGRPAGRPARRPAGRRVRCRLFEGR